MTEIKTGKKQETEFTAFMLLQINQPQSVTEIVSDSYVPLQAGDWIQSASPVGAD